MGSKPNPSPKLGFGPFEYDLLSGELWKRGIRIRVQGQPLQILSALLERPGQTVSREDLQSRIWANAAFGDFEQGLNTAVNKLRQALGDSADQPRYIETLPGRGYRFIAPVQGAVPKPVIELPAPYSPAPPVPQTVPVPLKPTWRTPVLTAVVLVVVAAAWWLGARRSSRPDLASLPSARFAVSPPPGFALEGAASRQSFALSPDGRRLAFTAMDADGLFSVFLRDVQSLTPWLLPGSQGAHTVFWSEDGSSLFLTVRGKLRRSELDSGSHLELGAVPSFLFSGTPLNAASVLLAGRSTYLLPISGGDGPRPLQEPYSWPQLLPGGEQIILHTEWDPDAGRHVARATRFGQPASTRNLLHADSKVLYTASLADPSTGFLLYVRRGALVASPFDPRSLAVRGEAMPVVNPVYSFFATGAADFSVSDSGILAYQAFVSRSQLVWVDRTGRQLGSLGPAGSNVKSARLSPDGRTLAASFYDVEYGAQSLWLLDCRTGAARRFLSQPDAVRDAPIWSPDGKTLAYLHGAGGRFPRIFLRETHDSEAAEQPLPDAGFQKPTDWSPDGRFIAFETTGIARLESEAQSDVSLIDLARGRELIPLLRTPFHEANAAFSPDGRWLAFTSDESGRPEVYLQAFSAAADPPAVSGDRYRVSSSGALALRWRRDGKELFYLGFDGRVHAVPVSLGPRPAFGIPKPLFTISTEARAAIHSLAGFDVTPDGQRFVIPVVAGSEAPSIVVVQNWEASLKR